MAHIHLTAAHAGAAAVAAVLVHLDTGQCKLVEKTVDRAQGTDKAAERPVAEDAGSADDQHDHELTRKQDLEH